jgi:hypothetical protein
MPPEIRNMIYELIMESSGSHLLHADLNSWDRLDFSRTCRQIFAETAPLYHGMKLLPLSKMTQILFDSAVLICMLECLTPSQKRAIRQAAICWCDWEEFRNEFKELRGLRMLTLLGAPVRMTRSARRRLAEIRECVGSEELEIAMERS